MAVFASGGGTNLQALMDHQAADPCWCVGLVVSDRADAGALERAAEAGVPTVTIATPHRTPEEVSAETLTRLREHEIDLIALAGYLKRIPAEVVAAYRNRILNIHPALLPWFGGPGMYGLRVHRAVLDAGSRLSGVSVHVVDEEYDRGRILAQWPVPVHPGDTPEELAARALKVEHRLYPAVVDHVCEALGRGEEPGALPFPGEVFLTMQAEDER